MNNIVDDGASVAHVGHVELLVPKPEESLAFFREVLGMDVSGASGQSVYLRGWRDHERYSLKLTEAPDAGIAHTAFRAKSEKALHRRVALLEDRGLHGSWIEGDEGHGPAYCFRNADDHLFELYFESERYTPPPEKASALKNQPARSPARGVAVERLDHVNLLSRDVRESRRFAQEFLDCALSEQLLLPDGTEIGAWLRVTSKSYDLVYLGDPAAAQNRLHHVAFRTETREDVLRAADIFTENGVFIEIGPAKHNIGGTFFLYCHEPSGNRIEVASGGYLILAPDWQPVVWTWEDDWGDRFQAWNTPFVGSFLSYGTPDVAVAQEATA